MNPLSNLGAIRARAEGGDPLAQANLAQALVGQDLDEAISWMEKSAGQGQPEAMYFLGVWHTEGALKPREMAKGLKYLGQAEKKGLPLARHYQAVLKAKGIGGDPDWQGAIADLIGLAKKENPFALSQLGFLMGMTGEPEAGGVGGKLIEAAAILGNPQAQGALEHVPTEKIAVEKAWLELAIDALKAPPNPALPKPQEFSGKPRIAVFPEIISHEIADYLVSRAKPRLKPSMVIDHIRGSFTQEEIRTSTELRFLPSQADLITHAVCERIAVATEEGVDQQEILGVLRYQPGQEYKPHSDFLKPDTLGKNPEVERSGQRIKTFLIYLNEEFEGGETDFPKLGIRLKGRKGDGILFTNVSDNGEESRLAVHAGRPVISGEKFITTLWIRDRIYTYPRAGD